MASTSRHNRHDDIIMDVLRGRERIVSYPATSRSNGRSIFEHTLAALHFMRVLFELIHDHGQERLVDVLQAITSTEIFASVFRDNRLAPATCHCHQHLLSAITSQVIMTMCSKRLGDLHLDIEDIRHVLPFDESLTHESTWWNFPTSEHFTRILQHMQTSRSSSAVIIVRSPKTIACVKITASLEKDIFLIFDPRPQPSYPFGADLILNTSIDQAVARLQTLFPAVGRRPPLSESQARILNNVYSYIFLSNRPAPSFRQAHRSHQHNSSPRSRYHPTASRTSTSFSCPICMDEHPMHNTIELDCDHQICRDCIRGHIRAKIEERYFPVFCPSCMGQGNRPTVIEGDHIRLIGVTEKEYAIWEEMELNQHSVLIHCRRCQRSVLVDKVDHEESEVLLCPLPNCNHSWCKLCQQPVDLGGPPHSCDGTTELHRLVQQQGWKYCPNCNIPVERDGGCRHMSCRCNTHFCYGCGQCIIRSTLQSEIDGAVHTHYHSGLCQMYEHDGDNDLDHEVYDDLEREVEDDEGVDSEGHGTEDSDGHRNEDSDGHGAEDSDGHGNEHSDGHGNEDSEGHGTEDSNCCCIS